eukprot:CAMPEP_0117446280 /NCGR_PEP_ID=MMETSP0759-20121206/6252_1 /TAXON_ID=63605 /ORGANISM="Percolomonas cosmopolitus, Strain WS" /LENGTH=477 /DNA_ID=CAMNT_0005238527 /DNA_START=823 /DNA_END=2256 /DNA_ORIENTATION=+
MPSKKSTTSNSAPTTNISRSWKCVFVNQNSVNPVNAAFQICLTSRTDGAAVNYVHDTLYGSIRYGITQQVVLPELQDTNLIMMRIQILDAVKGSEIRGKKEKLQGEKILDGVTESSMHLTNQETSFGGSKKNKWSKCYSVSSKIKFLDVSSNYDGSPFRFQISYYDPRALEKPIMVVQSAPFKVYARRKRKRGTPSSAARSKTAGVKSLAPAIKEEQLHESDLCSDSMDYGTNSMHPAEFDSENEFGAKKTLKQETAPSQASISFSSTIAEPPQKRQKKDLSSEDLFKLYISEFDQLMDLTKKMTKEERNKAVSAALQHLIRKPHVTVQQQQGPFAQPQQSATTLSQMFEKAPVQQQDEHAPLKLPTQFNDPLLNSSSTAQTQKKAQFDAFEFPQPQQKMIPSASLDVVHNPPSTNAGSTTNTSSIDSFVGASSTTQQHQAQQKKLSSPLNFDNLDSFGMATYDNNTVENNLFGFGF